MQSSRTPGTGARKIFSGTENGGLLAVSSFLRMHTETGSPSSPRLVRGMTWSAIMSGAVIALIGAGHLAAWLSGYFAERIFSTITMKTNTALSLLVCGIAVVMLAFPSRKTARLWAVRTSAVVVFVIGALTSGENLFGWDFHIDQILATELPGAPGVISPNRMGTPASLGFTLAGLAMLLLSYEGSRAVRNAQKLALAVLGTGLLGTLGFIYGVHQLYDLSRITTVAFPTAISLLLLGSALLCLRPAEGLMAAVTADDIGGHAVRRLLPWCIGLPLVVGYLRIMGERRGIYDSAMGVVLLILFIVCTISSLVYLNAVELSRRDAEERQIREALSRQAALLDLSPNAIIIRDIDGTIKFWSKGAEKLFGWKSEEAIGQNTNLLLQTEFPDPFEKIIEQLQSGRDWTGDLLQKTRSGRKVAVQGFWHGAVGGSGFEILESNLDITDRKLAEEALQKNEERLRTLANNMSQFAWMADEKGRIFWYNQRWFDYTGTALKEMEGWGWQKIVHADHVDRVVQRIRHCFETGEVWEDTFPLRGADGSYRWFLSRAIPIRDKQGKVLCWFGTNTDVTEQLQTQAELAAAKESAERAKEVAEQANRAKDHFLAVLSHELRTPLTPVVIGLSILEDRPDFDPKIRETLGMIRSNVEMEARLIDDLLDVTRIARGKVELNRTPVELCTIIQRAVEVCRPDIEARRLHFGVDLGPAAPYWVEADVSRLQQVFWNLLKNSVKFTPHDGCVGIRCLPNGEHVLVEVKDSGIGIEPGSLSRIFDAFEQTDRSATRQFGGLGLGLAISKALVELHGGNIEAHSEGRNKGATFRIRLPLSARVRQPEVPMPAAAPQGVVRPLHILLVEDHGVTAQMIRMVLAEKGHTVELAGDVATALKLANWKTFDLLLSDLGLPDGSGHDLIRELRERGHKFPAIALSGYGQEEDISRSYQAGFAAHLTKPASREAIFGMVASVASGDGHSKPDSSTIQQAEASIFDADAALKRCFGKPEMLAEMVDFFPKESAELMSQIRRALDKDDFPEVGQAAHRLKGSVVYLGAQAATDATVKMEQAAKSGDRTVALKAFTELEDKVELLKKTLTSRKQ